MQFHGKTRYTLQTFTVNVPNGQDASYVAEEDPTLFVSEKTGRGPLSEDWVQMYAEECVVSE